MQSSETGAREQSHPFEFTKVELRAGGESVGGGAKGNKRILSAKKRSEHWRNRGVCQADRAISFEHAEVRAHSQPAGQVCPERSVESVLLQTHAGGSQVRVRGKEIPPIYIFLLGPCGQGSG